MIMLSSGRSNIQTKFTGGRGNKINTMTDGIN
jgi:hypothetical protein